MSPGQTAPKLTPPREALTALLDRLAPVEAESVALAEASGRILAEPITADRPSPACDVSAMDGYAVRLADLKKHRLPMAGEVATGQAPPELPLGAAVRIFTGGAVPPGAEAVIRREDVTEHPDAIELSEATIKPGANIRRQGENTAAGAEVLEPGTPINAATAAALATFGITRPKVHRRLRVGVLVTGDEVLPPEAQPEPWQLRDSNAHTLRALLAPLPWISLQQVRRIKDEPEPLTTAVREAIASCDALILTGGVSMGDHDHVPAAIQAAGAETIFHKLAIRPGKPMLGAIGPAGQPILGLPGNPVSVMVTARRLAIPTLRRLAGFAVADPPAPAVRLRNPGEKRLGLWWYRIVRLTGAGEVEPVATRGSGDPVSAAQSDGFVEIPPKAGGEGPWPFYQWEA